MELIATIEDPKVVRQILDPLGVPPRPKPPSPPDRPPPPRSLFGDLAIDPPSLFHEPTSATTNTPRGEGPPGSRATVSKPTDVAATVDGQAAARVRLLGGNGEQAQVREGWRVGYFSYAPLHRECSSPPRCCS